MVLGPRWFRMMDPEAIGLGLSVFFEFVAVAAEEHPDAVARRHREIEAWSAGAYDGAPLSDEPYGFWAQAEQEHAAWAFVCFFSWLSGLPIELPLAPGTYTVVHGWVTG